MIKSFYYDNVMPNNVTQIIETRLLVRKADGWHAYDYIWNVAQTDAELDVLENGKIVPITWIQDGTQMSVNYKTPSQTQCVTCHKLNSSSIANGEKTIPIGPKPQNLNTTYNYATGAMNQLQKWKAMGFLGNDIPATINSTIDWRDVSQSLELRARSYIDINCAHCHRTGGHCDYAPQRFNFNNPNLRDFGVCLPATSASNGFIINGGSPSGSYLITKISSTEQAVMMPPIGRQVVDQEGLQLMTDWINSLPRCR